ncbi:hypothetical protein DSO57_1029881 [Entomophthora muscae]|uniref:Uncharacterized protein n=1 Tax=Entomophthora muscae TaxID=34485 RepID=A0ACC2SQ85_9FUNG|nr:hypothetical protein DSO57_1029881 [Entomophthora muscae]
MTPRYTDPDYELSRLLSPKINGLASIIMLKLYSENLTVNFVNSGVPRTGTKLGTSTVYTSVLNYQLLVVIGFSQSVMNDISILVLKTWESNPGSKKKPCYDQDRQEPARLPVGPNPGLPEISCPNQKEQKPANLPSVKTEGLKSALETPELNPDSPKATRVTQNGWEPANLLSCIPKLSKYSETCQTLEDNSPNGHQISINFMPP